MAFQLVEIKCEETLAFYQVTQRDSGREADAWATAMRLPMPMLPLLLQCADHRPMCALVHMCRAMSRMLTETWCSWRMKEGEEHTQRADASDRQPPLPPLLLRRCTAVDCVFFISFVQCIPLCALCCICRGLHRAALLCSAPLRRADPGASASACTAPPPPAAGSATRGCPCRPFVLPSPRTTPLSFSLPPAKLWR